MARAARSQQNDEPDEEEVEPDDDDQEDDDQEEEEDEEYKPPTAAEWKSTQAALKKANTEAKRFRTELRNARKKATDADADPDRAAAKVEERWKPRVVRSEARAALAAAGAKPSALGRLARTIDLDEVEIDDDGEVTGLDDLIEELKEDLPELFKDSDDDDEPAPRRKRRLGKTDAGAKGSANGAKTLTSSERQARAILGK
jgi:minor structural protein GP20